MHTADGEVIEVAEIGSMAPDFDDISGSVLDWLTAQAGDRDIEIHPNFAPQRIVFDEGEAIGVVFATPGGPLAVHARHGVTVGAGSPRVNTPLPHQLPDGAADLRVGLVGRHASRFGRLELLTSDPIARHAPSTCRPCSRQVRANLRETHGQSPARRCARGEGYPSQGQ